MSYGANKLHSLIHLSSQSVTQLLIYNLDFHCCLSVCLSVGCERERGVCGSLKEAVSALSKWRFRPKNAFKFYFLNIKIIPLTIAVYKITTTELHLLLTKYFIIIIINFIHSFIYFILFIYFYFFIFIFLFFYFFIFFLGGGGAI